MDARLQKYAERLPPPPDLAAFDLKIQTALRDLEAKWLAVLDTRLHELSDAESRSLTSLQGDLGARVAAVEARPALTPVDVTGQLDEGLRAAVAPRLDELGHRLEALETRPALGRTDVEAHVAEGLEASVAPRFDELTRRLDALEERPAVSTNEVASQIDQRIQAVDPKFLALEQKVRDAVKISGEAWAERLRTELQAAVDDLAGRSARAEEELRTALVAQLDLEIRETKDQGSALREEIETRVRDLLKERLAEGETKRAKDVRDLEQRLGLLVDGRSKDLEARLTALLESTRSKGASQDDERLSQTERRLALEQEARAAELAESQTQTLAGFQVRMQSFFEQKLRENQEREREKYVELLARFKGEVDQSLSRTIDSGRFDVAVQERVARALVAVREEQDKAIAAGVADAELRLRAAQEEGIARLEHVEGKLQQRENDLGRVERSVRHDLEELDRRVEVLTDRMLPLVRRTWEKVGEIEKGGGTPVEADAQMKEIRRELTRELRRVEGELLEQTSELRDKLESTLQSQGRIWLNFVRQLSAAGEELAPPPGPAGARPPRRTLRAPVGVPTDEDALGADLPETGGIGAFDSDPVNPLDPRAESPPEAAEREPRRRTRRSTPG